MKFNLLLPLIGFASVVLATPQVPAAHNNVVGAHLSVTSANNANGPSSSLAGGVHNNNVDSGLTNGNRLQGPGHFGGQYEHESSDNREYREGFHPEPHHHHHHHHPETFHPHPHPHKEFHHRPHPHPRPHRHEELRPYHHHHHHHEEHRPHKIEHHREERHGYENKYGHHKRDAEPGEGEGEQDEQGGFAHFLHKKHHHHKHHHHHHHRHHRRPRAI